MQYYYRENLDSPHQKRRVNVTQTKSNLKRAQTYHRTNLRINTKYVKYLTTTKQETLKY